MMDSTLKQEYYELLAKAKTSPTYISLTYVQTHGSALVSKHRETTLDTEFIEKMRALINSANATPSFVEAVRFLTEYKQPLVYAETIGQIFSDFVYGYQFLNTKPCMYCDLTKSYLKIIPASKTRAKKHTYEHAFHSTQFILNFGRLKDDVEQEVLTQICYYFGDVSRIIYEYLINPRDHFGNEAYMKCIYRR